MKKNSSLAAAVAVWLGTGLLLGGCSTPKEPFGAEIRKTLDVKKDTLEKTENSPEKNFDAKVILKRAEAYYQKDDFIEAVGEYQHFIDLHPLHEWAEYAQFKLGMSYFHQIRTIDRDPEPTQNALSAFQKFLSVYPDSQYAEEARKRIRMCETDLAEHQLYVGRFYYKKGAYPAAIERFTRLLDAYPKLPPAEEALYYLGMSYYRSEDPEQAAAHLKDLVGRYPDSPYRGRVEKLLARLNGSSNR
jgi:outer membrane protein assembly factor BamD